jgi:hypothetical protein
VDVDVDVDVDTVDSVEDGGDIGVDDCAGVDIDDVDDGVDDVDDVDDVNGVIVILFVSNGVCVCVCVDCVINVDIRRIIYYYYELL